MPLGWCGDVVVDWFHQLLPFLIYCAPAKLWKLREDVEKLRTEHMAKWLNDQHSHHALTGGKPQNPLMSSPYHHQKAMSSTELAVVKTTEINEHSVLWWIALNK